MALLQKLTSAGATQHSRVLWPVINQYRRWHDPSEIPVTVRSSVVTHNIWVLLLLGVHICFCMSGTSVLQRGSCDPTTMWEWGKAGLHIQIMVLHLAIHHSLSHLSLFLLPIHHFLILLLCCSFPPPGDCVNDVRASGKSPVAVNVHLLTLLFMCANNSAHIWCFCCFLLAFRRSGLLWKRRVLWVEKDVVHMTPIAPAHLRYAVRHYSVYYTITLPPT